ncbi:hypothetical protein GG496_000974 [Candidatus Fervidibacteria bacterium JGI MDM2 JNZ-1-D12]
MSLLRQVAEAMNLNPDAVEALSSLKTRRVGRTKAGLEISYRDPKISEEFRRQQILRASAKLKEPAAPLQISSTLISPTRSIVVLRRGEEITIWQLRLGVAKRAPKISRMIAQKLPSQKVRTVFVEKVIVSTPTRTDVLLPPLRQRGVPLPEAERRSLNSPREWYLRFEDGVHVSVIEGSPLEVRERLKRIQSLPIAKRLFISSDLEHWTRLSELYLP